MTLDYHQTLQRFSIGIFSQILRGLLGARQHSNRLLFQFAQMWPVKLMIRNKPRSASLVTQWLQIHLPMQGTQVRALVREDPTCCGATKPVRHNY